MSFQKDQRVIRSSDAIAKELDGELVLLDLQSGTYFGLNEVGSRIWELMESPVSVAEINAKLLDEFEVSDVVLAADVDAFLDVLHEKKLLTLS
jgi:hypothetical protein